MRLMLTPHTLLKDSRRFHFTPENFREALHTLLWIEEAEITNSMRRYDIEDAQFTKSSLGHYVIQVEGLAEKRPSVLRGDEIRAEPIEEDANIFVGYAHFVNFNNVHISFNEHISLHKHFTVNHQ